MSRALVSDDAVRAAFLAVYEAAHIEGVTRLDVRRALEAAAPYMAAPQSQGAE